MFTAACSLLYHSFMLILFLILKVYPMFYVNIGSVSLYIGLLIVIPKQKNFLFPYILAAVEVILHQMLADHFLGTESSFHFFILLMGLLPFLIFEIRFTVVVPFTTITSVLFILYENMTIPPIYEISPGIISRIKYLNITLTLFMIIFMIFLYTLIVSRIEENLQKQNRALESEIKMASAIQQSFFRHNDFQIEGWNIASFNAPMAGVSGDLYDIYDTGSCLDGLGIFDVSGHGISSGLVTMLVKNIIYQEFYNHRDQPLDDVMNTINDRFINEKGDIENYMTGILMRTDGNVVEFVNAGHPMPLLYRKADGSCQYIRKSPASMGAVGLTGLPVSYITQTAELNEGDELVFFTDGITDTLDAADQNFSYEGLRKVISEHADLPPAEQIDKVMTALEHHRNGTPVTDDSTIIILRKA